MGVPLDKTSNVIYVGIDREQARRNAWPYFKAFAEVIEEATGLSIRLLEKTAEIHLPDELGGCVIRLLGMDNPDAARGLKLRYAVLDEYADMPPRVWPEIIRPALADVRGGALFIGTPKGRNHFYELIEKALEDARIKEEEGEQSAWAVFNFSSHDNTLIEPDELKEMAHEYTNGSEDLYEQEIAAKFISSSGQLFTDTDFKIIEAMPPNLDYFLAVDLAGFSADPDRKREIRKLDDTAIAVVGVDERGNWFVKEIDSGKWGVRETALRIVTHAHKNQIPIIGIERGVLMQAVEPYMREYMAQFNRWFEIKPLTHGNKNKFDRIQWALQGRAQKGKIYLLKGEWNRKFIDQAVSFPSKYVHDDLVDALAYIDQLALETLGNFDISQIEQETQFVPHDIRTGY
jgi:phage terminase large subunit-like protein